jgi:hypothetical protein
MKTVRLILIVVVLSLLLGTLIPAFGAQESAAVNTSSQTLNAAALDSPFISPFLFAASAPVIVAAGEQPESNTYGYSCKLTAQKPADWTPMVSRNIFNVSWTLKNVGTKVWGIHGVDVRYRGDTRMHYKVPDLFDLPKKVGPGQNITLKLDMMAPKLPGYYVSNWGFYVGNLVFCKFYVIIVVTR